MIEKIAEMSPSSCGLELADYEQNTIAELQLRTKCFLQEAELRSGPKKKVPHPTSAFLKIAKCNSALPIG
jgi:hypothetical protein